MKGMLGIKGIFLRFGWGGEAAGFSFGVGEVDQQG
jgi:hypothetical protein